MAVWSNARGSGGGGGGGLAALCCALLLWAAATAAPAPPAAGTQDGIETNSDLPVEQLEKLKAEPAPQRDPLAPELPGQPDQPGQPGQPGQPSQSGQRAPQSATTTTPPPEETTAKVFHGAARLVQPGAGAPPPAPPVLAPPALAPPAHSAVRRSFNADIHKETEHNRDHFSAYGGVQYSPLDMAEYVLWTGDERAVTAAVESLLEDGLMTKEEAIVFLQEIKLYLEYLRAQYADAAESDARDRSPLLLDQNDKPTMEAAEWPPLALSGELARALSARRWELNNALSPFPAPPPLPPRPRRRDYGLEPLLPTNWLGDAGADYRQSELAQSEETMRAQLAEALAAQRALEELLYYLAKMLFAQSEAREGGAAESARRVLRRARPALRRRLLDIIIAALTDTIGDHPELLQARESYEIPSYRLMRDFLDASAAGAPAQARLPRGY